MEHIGLYVRKISKDSTLRYLIISTKPSLKNDSRFDQLINGLAPFNNEEKELICVVILESLHAGSPLPSLLNDFASDANWWVKFSSMLERMHYWKAISDSFELPELERAIWYIIKLRKERNIF